ncbi:hypothetical protein G1K46_12450 [Tenacibaculum finnmarkense]|uniref:hypothetical protein n=1 Tax=Tenacibaculum finnmarkense TaxID=2781243 RepID=UPI001EFB1013|nr:hypothetical protein [Tenacibaculum finnmarkense]MCG8763527.1 hypothetical protein [Tenacibaculum finnmarkense]MCG8788918.1 hypothetical protein [Tenacibaculum finnmarkense]
MTQKPQKTDLKELLKTNPVEFLNECLAKSENGKMSEICQYVQLTILDKRGELLTEQEKRFLSNLNEKYSDIEIGHLEDINNKNKPFSNINDAKTELKDISQNIVDSVKVSHQKSRNERDEAFLEFVTAFATNIRTDRKLRYKYNFKNNQELFNCFDNYETQTYKLSDDLIIKLKPRPFIHILLGHVEKYIIHRKGEMVRFTQVNDWKELLTLINEIVHYIKDQLIEHYKDNNEKYDNKCFTYNGKIYGIHLDKNAEIKTLYERKNVC